MVTVKVSDTSPKRIIRQMLAECKGERDYSGMDALMAAWNGPSPQQSFGKYCRSRDWTLTGLRSPRRTATESSTRATSSI